jgi:flagellar biosynthesis chaperone FliJ
MYIQSLEDRIKDKEQEVKDKAEECEKWRQKFVDMEKQYVSF